MYIYSDNNIIRSYEEDSNEFSRSCHDGSDGIMRKP